MKKNIHLVIAIIFIGVVISTKINQLGQVIKDYETKTKIQNERMEQLKLENKNLNKEKEELNKKLEAKAIQKRSQVVRVTPVNLYNVEQWRLIVSKYPWPVEDALKIMACESGGVTTKNNYNPATGDNSWGLYQVNLWGSNAYSRPPASELIKPEVNIQYAYNIWSSSGRFGTTHGWYNCARKVNVT